jgi:hypothetical protein
MWSKLTHNTPHHPWVIGFYYCIIIDNKKMPKNLMYDDEMDTMHFGWLRMT